MICSVKSQQQWQFKYEGISSLLSQRKKLCWLVDNFSGFCLAHRQMSNDV
jgi:hypothetical protein